GPGAYHIWMGDSEMGLKHYDLALQEFQKAAEKLKPENGKKLHDDFRCQLAGSQVKAGSALLALGKAAEAEKSFLGAMETLGPSLKAELEDIPAYYVVADAYAGLGESENMLAATTRDSLERQKLSDKACDNYAKSFEFWKKIPNPSRLSPSMLLVHSE